MSKVRQEIEEYEALIEDEFRKLIEWTMTLDEDMREGYLHFSLGQRAVRLRLERRIYHKKEAYEVCAAINIHLKKVMKMLNDKGPLLEGPLTQ